MRISLAVLLLAGALSAYAQGGGPPAPAPVQWQRVVSEDDAFSVSMPGKPKFKRETLTAKNGHSFRYSSYMADLGRSAYNAAYSDYDRQTEISVDGAIEGVLGSWKEPKIISRSNTLLDVGPTQIIDFTSGEYRVIVRVFVIGKRLYQLGFVENRADFKPEHASGFFDSFRLR